jgi:hypothetical protein
MAQSELHAPASPAAAWPALPLAAWCDTYATLHMWTQIVEQRGSQRHRKIISTAVGFCAVPGIPAP